MGKSFTQARTGYVFTGESDGTVHVLDPSTGLWGRFTRTGEWIEGELTHAEEVMCDFVSGAQVPARTTEQTH